MSTVALVAPAAPTAAVPVPERALSVTGTEVEMYPAFDPAITRYAVTTTTNTGGSLTIDATPGPSETVTVDGQHVTDATDVHSLTPGDEVSVVFSSSTGRSGYSIVYLPDQFPRLDVIGGAKAAYPGVADGLIGLTLTTFATGPSFSTIVDRNGVPVWVVNAAGGDLDLKQQPLTGDLTIFRPATGAGKTGSRLVTLDDSFGEASSIEVADPLTNTDDHDAEKLADGSTLLLGYEPNGTDIDSTIQKVDAGGNVVFQWSSAPYRDESVNFWTPPAFPGMTDYAHVNSIQEVPDGTGDVIASFRHFSSVYRIATRDHDGVQKGDVVWKFGGRHSDFTFPDDPYNGPCAQHAASLTPDGHLMVFDNGSANWSGAMCIDPSDPLGTPIERPFTRVAEYSLDTVAGSASLVWSYGPDDYAPDTMFAFFAGSARRLANGNTLIGWASEMKATATEVDSAKNELWAIQVPTGNNYKTYRAALITALAPGATFSGPADHATVLVGDQVPADATCRDFAGRSIDTCEVTGLLDGKLDTRTAGTRTWQVTSSYGAGNTTTITRHYTVRAATRRPDGLIRKAGSSTWKGGNVYGAATGQTVRQHVRSRHPAKSFWSVQNDGERSDGFLLKGTAGSARFKVRYFAGGTDVTSAVVAGTYRTPTLAPGASTVLRVKVVATRRAHDGDTRKFRLRSTSLSTSAAVDKVATEVTAR
jgi:hypothetical protein